MKKLVADAQSVVGQACAAYFYRVDAMKGVEFEYEYVYEDEDENNYDEEDEDTNDESTNDYFTGEVDLEEPTVSAMKKMKTELERKQRKIRKVKRCIKLPPANCNCNASTVLMTTDYFILAFFIVLSVNVIWIVISLFHVSYVTISKKIKNMRVRVDSNNNNQMSDREMDIRLTNFLNAHTPPTPPPTISTPVMIHHHHDYEDVVSGNQEEEYERAENKDTKPIPALRGSFKKHF